MNVQTPSIKESIHKLAGPAALVGVLALAPLTAGAQSMDDPEYDEPGIYLGGGVGYNRIETQEFPNDDDDIEDSRVSYKGIAGFRVNRVLSFEGQYIDFGTAEDGENNLKADGWTVGAVLTLPLSPYINPYAKAGALIWDADGTSVNPDTPISNPTLIKSSDDGTDFTYGVGVNFDLPGNLALRTEYERFELSDTSVDMGSANLIFNF